MPNTWRRGRIVFEMFFGRLFHILGKKIINHDTFVTINLCYYPGFHESVLIVIEKCSSTIFTLSVSFNANRTFMIPAALADKQQDICKG